MNCCVNLDHYDQSVLALRPISSGLSRSATARSSMNVMNKFATDLSKPVSGMTFQRASSGHKYSEDYEQSFYQHHSINLFAIFQETT